MPWEKVEEKKKGWEVVEPPKIQLPQPATLPIQQAAQSTFPQSQKDIGLFTGFEKIPGWFAAGGLGKKTLATLTKTPGTEWARYQEPKGIGEKIAAGLTELVGFFGLPIGLGKLATKPLIKFFGSYLIKQPFLARLVQYGIQNAATLGTAEAIRDIVDIKGTPKRIADGMITGTIFSIAGLSHITKYPILNQVLSQGGGRALEVLLKRYPKEYFTKENLPDLVFNEALKSVFYAQGTNLKTVLANMEDIPQEKGRIKLSSNPDELARLNQRLQEMLIVSARKPEQVKTWVEKKWRKKPETKPPEVLPPELQPTEISPMPEEIKIKSPIRKEEKFWTKEETEKYLKGRAESFEKGFEEAKEMPRFPKTVEQYTGTIRAYLEGKSTKEQVQLLSSRRADIKREMAGFQVGSWPWENLLNERNAIDSLLTEARKTKKIAPIPRPEEKIPIEQALQAAIQYGGKIYTGRSHIEALDSMPENLRNEALEKAGNIQTGWITPGGQFVERLLPKTEVAKPPISPTGEKAKISEKPLTEAEQIAEYYKQGKVETVPPWTEEHQKAFEKTIAGQLEEKFFGEKEEPEKTRDLYSGLPVPEFLKTIDKYLEKKYGIKPKEPIEKAANAVINQEIKTPLIEEKEKTWKPLVRIRLNLRRMGGTGNTVADWIENFQKNAAQKNQRRFFLEKSAYILLANDYTKTQKIFNPRQITQETARRLWDLGEGKDVPKTENEQVALKIIQQMMNDFSRQVQTYNEKAIKEGRNPIKIITMFGEKNWQPLEKFMPREYKNTREFLESDKFKHLRDWQIEEIAKKNFPELYIQKPEEGLKAADDYFEEFRNDLKTRPVGHLERQRLLDEEILEKLRTKWYQLYPDKEFPLEPKKSWDVLARYIGSVTNRLEWIENFGTDVAYGKGEYIPEKLKGIRYKFEKETNKRYVMNFFKDYLRRGVPLDTRTTRWLRTINTFQLTKLAFAWQPNSLQWFTNTVPLLDTRSSIEALWDTAKFYGLAGKEAKIKTREFFSKTGAENLRSALQLALTEDPSKINTLADIFLKLHLFTGTEFFNALYSGFGGAKKAIRLSEKLHKVGKEGWRSPFYITELKKLGLTPEKIEWIIKEGPLTEKDVVSLADAAYYMRRTAQFLGDAFELPKTWSTPLGRTIVKFKNFAFNQTSLIYNEGIKEAYKFISSAGRQGDITKLMKMMVTLPVAGALVTKFKEWLYPKLGLNFYEELMAGKSWPLKAMVFLLNTGNLGLAADIFLAAKYGKAGLTSLLGGPTWSDISEIGSALFNTGKELWTAISNHNLKWIEQRSATIRDYWLRVGERLSPDLRIIILNFFKDYKQIKDANMWNRIVTDAYTKYKELYILQSPEKANEFWRAFIETQGKEYEEIFGRKPQKPTKKDIDQWWKEQGKTPGARVKMKGKKLTKTNKFTSWY